MDIPQIIYKVKTATAEEIHFHLKNNKNDFHPALDKRVDIKEYSKKIFDKSITFEAWLDKILIGIVAVYYNDFQNHVGFITYVNVCKKYTGLGLASELLKMCVRYAKQNNFKEIKLEVHKNNSPAIHLYKNSGFNNYAINDDLILMKLLINSLSQPSS